MKSALGVVVAMGLSAGACGDVVALNRDGGPDAPPGIDAGPDAPESGAIGVKVFTLDPGDGQIDATAIVAVMALDGTTIAVGPVDAEGTFTATIPAAGAHVHVARPGNGSSRQPPLVSSVLGALPGEQLVFGIPPGYEPPRQPETQMTATVQAVSGYTNYYVYTPCTGRNGVFAGTNPPIATLSFYEGCHGDTFPALAVTTNGQNMLMAYLPGAPYEPGTNITLPLFSSASSSLVTIDNVPPAVSELEVTRWTVLEGRTVAPQTTYYSSGVSSPLQATVLRPPVASLGGELELSAYRTDSGSRHTLTTRTALSSGTQTVDLAALPLPWLGEGGVDADGFAWTAVEADGTGDALATVVNAGWTDSQGSPARVAWRVIGPWSDTGRTHPVLPPELAAYDPHVHAGDPDFSLSGFMQSIDIDALDAAAIRLQGDVYFYSSDAVAKALGSDPFQMRKTSTSLGLR